jgi:fermentation-respiration switch protein FrsA (DUF1100 family)
MGSSQRRPSWLRRVTAAVVAVVLVVGVALGAVWVFQSRLVFHPSRATLPPASAVVPGAVDVTLTTADGLRLGAWFVPPAVGAEARDQAVLVAPGNGGDRSGRAGLGEQLAERGFAVLLMDYRGYARNPGSPSEAGVLLDARAAQRELAARGYPPDRTIYLGESIGTGVVAGLQAQVPPAGMVLRSPFTSVPDVARALLPLPHWLADLLLDRNVFPVAQQVAASDVPLTVLQGDADTLIPPAQSDAVAAAARHLVEHISVPGAGHNDPEWHGALVADAVARLADAVSP